jgi:hypothetical protein
MNVKLDKWGAQGDFLGSWVATGFEFEELYGDGTLGLGKCSSHPEARSKVVCLTPTLQTASAPSPVAGR